jgi:hypothetical protein
MRLTSSYIEALMQTAGPFIGDDRANAVVTVERDWWLSEITGIPTGDSSKLPYRWWQRADNSQVETVIPNVASIAWDRSIDSDAASCKIQLANQKMDLNLSGQNHRLGQRGYLTWRTRSPEVLRRWPENTNDWAQVLIPNALLRTYEGFGGHDKTLTQALNDGNLLLTGVWLIDDVVIGTEGNVEMQCRDMGKLLLEQQVYLPLVPAAKYPLMYQKWRYETHQYVAVPYYDRTDPAANDGPFYGPGNEGRKWAPEIGIDVDNVGYAILGTDGGVFTYETTFYGSRGQGFIQGIVGFTPRTQGDGYWAVDKAGSVFAQGAAAHLGSPSDLFDPIVRMESTHTGNGYWLLDRSGDVMPFGDATYLGGLPDGAAPMVDMARTANSQGYVMVSESGQVYAFGNAPYFGNAPIPTGQKAAGIAMTPTGAGYWIVGTDGAVYAFGDAPYIDRVNNPNAPMAAVIGTSSGAGYYLLGQDGGVFAFGDAVFHGTPPAGVYRDMGLAPTGYWVIADSGQVYPIGPGVPDYGSPTPGVDAAPMRGLAMDPLGRGYWLAGEDGSVFAFGECGFYGRMVNPNAPIVRIEAHPSGRGYWLLGADGGVFWFSAQGFPGKYFGSAVGVLVGTAVDMAVTPSGEGYWILGNLGHVYAFGDAVYAGNAPITGTDKASGIAARKAGGYWIVSENGGIFALGGAPFLQANGDWSAAKANLQDPIVSIDASRSVTGEGYLLLGGDGGVYSFGDAPFEGSLPAPYMTTQQFPGNYDDLSDIVKDLLLWSGWWLYGGTGVYGNIESTGTYVETDLTADVFDKKPVMDAINQIRDVVGYLFWVDEEGGAHFESPNWFTYGNFLQESGLRIGGIPEIDERVSLTNYSLTYTDRPIRSVIIITSDDPTLNYSTTITTNRPVTSNLLRGMVRPAMIGTPFNVTAADQAIMAERIEQQIHFQSEQSSVTCVANPAIQINDQVRLWEQITGESNVHFVRGISSQHDLETGVWTYTLTTNNLGAGRSAAPTGEIPVVPEPVS